MLCTLIWHALPGVGFKPRSLIKIVCRGYWLINWRNLHRFPQKRIFWKAWFRKSHGTAKTYCTLQLCLLYTPKLRQSDTINPPQVLPSLRWPSSVRCDDSTVWSLLVLSCVIQWNRCSATSSYSLNLPSSNLSTDVGVGWPLRGMKRWCCFSCMLGVIVMLSCSVPAQYGAARLAWLIECYWDGRPSLCRALLKLRELMLAPDQGSSHDCFLNFESIQLSIFPAPGF